MDGRRVTRERDRTEPGLQVDSSAAQTHGVGVAGVPDTVPVGSAAVVVGAAVSDPDGVPVAGVGEFVGVALGDRRAVPDAVGMVVRLGVRDAGGRARCELVAPTAGRTVPVVPAGADTGTGRTHRYSTKTPAKSTQRITVERRTLRTSPGSRIRRITSPPSPARSPHSSKR